MTLLKPFFAVVLLCAAQVAAADESFEGALHRGAAVHPSQYSFADLYRATVAGPAVVVFPVFPTTEAPVRVATSAAPPQFSVSDVPEPQLGLLLLSGVALAVWVGRRRLGYGLR